MTEPETPAPLSLRKRLLFSGILLLLMATILEGGSRVYLRTQRGWAGGEFLQYQFDAYKNIHPTRNWVDTRGVKHNAQGFRRSTDVAREKAPGTYRVILMGASTAYGLGTMWPHIEPNYAAVQNTETIDAYLEQILAKQLPYERVEVINAGIPSIYTHHELIYLNQSILGYQPDMVLFLDGWNDHFFTDRDHDQFASYAQQRKADEIMGPASLKSLVDMNLWWFFRWSAFGQVSGRAARDLATVIRGPGERAPIDVAKAVEDVQWVFDRNARKMIERNALILQHEGIPAIFMLQPMLALERANLGRMPQHERDLFEFNITSFRPNYEQFLLQAKPLIAKRIEESVTPLGASFIDMTGIYTKSEGQIFTDYAHLTPEGNRLLAERVAPEVVRREAMQRTAARRRAP